MRDDQHRLVGVAGQHLGDELLYTRREVRKRLGVRGARSVAGQPARMLVPELGLDLCRRLSFPCPEPALTQARVEPHLCAERLSEDLGRFARTRQVAAVDGVDVAQLGGEAPRLHASCVVERRVGMALPAAVPVPIRLAVAYEQKGGHETD